MKNIAAARKLIQAAKVLMAGGPHVDIFDALEALKEEADDKYAQDVVALVNDEQFEDALATCNEALASLQKMPKNSKSRATQMAWLELRDALKNHFYSQGYDDYDLMGEDN